MCCCRGASCLCDQSRSIVTGKAINELSFAGFVDPNEIVSQLPALVHNALLTRDEARDVLRAAGLLPCAS